MADMSNPPDPEFSAMNVLYAALEPLDSEARKRVVAYIVARLGMTHGGPILDSGPIDLGGDQEPDLENETNIAPKYGTLAELCDATHPTTAAHKALVAGYWLQVCQGGESFDGFSANKELKHLGEGVANITVAMDALKSQKPALALQLKKAARASRRERFTKSLLPALRRWRP